MKAIELEVKQELAAWLGGRKAVADFQPSLLAESDLTQALESGDHAAVDQLHIIAFASALCAGEPSLATAQPEIIRSAPWDMQALWFASSTHAPVRLGGSRVVLSSAELNSQGLFEQDEETTIEEMERRRELEYPWHVTLHTNRAQFAVHDHGNTFELRWNRGDVNTTLLRIDDEQGVSREEGWAGWLLSDCLGTNWPNDTSALKKRARSDWAPPHRRLWELAAFLDGRRNADALESL